MVYSSLTHELHEETQSKARGESILFSCQSSPRNDNDNNNNNDTGNVNVDRNINLTYNQCWQIVHEHEQWLQSTIERQLSLSLSPLGIANTATTHNNCNGGDINIKSDTAKVKDVVIGYLADNSPDLLLSVLACMNLTNINVNMNGSNDHDETAKRNVHILPIPAMINGRWTPSEMERALRPSYREDHDLGDGSRCHATIVLYGAGYEATAIEAVRLMLMMQPNPNQSSFHFAVALPLPSMVHKYYYRNNDGLTKHSYNTHQSQSSSSAVQNINHSHSAPTTTDIISNNDALLLFTSGTSSPNGAKGVRLSHRSLYVQAYAKTQSPCQYNAQTAVVATTVPWFHVGGMSSALAVLLAGGCLVFPPSTAPVGDEQQGSAGGRRGVVRRKGFQPGLVLQSIHQHATPDDDGDTTNLISSIAANTLVVVPAMLHAIIADHNANHHNKHSNDNTKFLASCSTTRYYPNVKLILVGGQSIGNGKLYKQTRQLFPKARLVQTYACTEAGSSMTFEDLGWDTASSSITTVRQGDAAGGGFSNTDPDRHHRVHQRNDVKEDNADHVASLTHNDIGMDGATCVGSPPPHIEMGIFDPKNASSVMIPNGKMGIIGTRGPHTMSGYWNRGGSSISNKSTHDNDNKGVGRRGCSGCDADGRQQWMLTNDLGYIHPSTGKLYFCGRANDVIRTGGESVLATEVERVLDTHVDVVECAVFALPDEKFGEAVCAAIVFHNGATKDEGTLSNSYYSGNYNDRVVAESLEWTRRIREYCAKRQLAGFKWPRRVFSLQALPRNSSGKVLKHVIIRQCASQSRVRRSRL